ncbi:hypothetical protein ACQY0O_007852 [Thecaphora frezii]
MKFSSTQLCFVVCCLTAAPRLATAVPYGDTSKGNANDGGNDLASKVSPKLRAALESMAPMYYPEKRMDVFHKWIHSQIQHGNVAAEALLKGETKDVQTGAAYHAKDHFSHLDFGSGKIGDLMADPHKWMDDQMGLKNFFDSDDDEGMGMGMDMGMGMGMGMDMGMGMGMGEGEGEAAGTKPSWGSGELERLLGPKGFGLQDQRLTSAGNDAECEGTKYAKAVLKLGKQFGLR